MTSPTDPGRDLLAGAPWAFAQAPPAPDGTPPPEGLRWAPARVPGTSAVAVRDGGEEPAGSHDDVDWWWTTEVTGEGPHQLVLEGVATRWELWWDGELVAGGSSMFRTATLEVALQGRHRLALVCRSLTAATTPRRPRAPWRSLLVTDPAFRWHRTTALGRIGWPGARAVAGPWRPVRLVPRPAATLGEVRTDLDGDVGVVHLEGRGDQGCEVVARLVPAGAAGDGTRAEGSEAVAEAAARIGADGTFALTLRCPDARLWWPRPHGAPEHYRLEVLARSGQLRESIVDRLVGFRTVTADRADGGFGLVVNGRPLRVRGVCWSPPDPADPGSTARVREDLRRIAAMGANLVRLTGTTTPAPPELHQECVRAGLMLWHDLMLHTLPPPEDEQWEAELLDEARELLRPLQGAPHLVVVSGGSETQQQPVLWGLPTAASHLPVLDRVVDVVGQVVPGVVAVTSTPSGGWRPTAVGEGISHYFGVGGYRRPLSDARTSGVRFAAECLALGTPATRATVARHFPDLVRDDPRWRAAAMADPGADWTFEDVSAHYARTVLGVDVDALDPARRLDVLRAASAHVLAQTLAEWRRPGSVCRGAVVLCSSDLVPGSGWGLLDGDGRPKATWHLASEVWAPRAVLLTDEGLDGYAAHLVNDRPEPWDALLRITCRDRAGRVVAEGSRRLGVAAGSGLTCYVEDVLGSFKDLTGAWGFGAPAVSSVVATVDGTEDTRAVAFHPDLLPELVSTAHPPEVLRARYDAGLGELRLLSTVDLPFVSVDGGDEPWLHLPAGCERALTWAGPPPTAARSLALAHPVRLDAAP